MQMFDDCVAGVPQFNGSKLLSQYKKALKRLVRKRLGVYHKPLPEYIIKLFNTMCDNIKHIHLSLEYLNGTTGRSLTIP